MRQKQKGYGYLRLAVIGGNLTAENIKKVAEVAEKYGRGYVHMTSRQGIEIPFIKVEELAEVKEELAKGGVGTGVCGPRVRTITACQGSEVCPSGCIDTYWHKNWMPDISDGNFRISSNSVLPDVRITV